MIGTVIITVFTEDKEGDRQWNEVEEGETQDNINL